LGFNVYYPLTIACEKNNETIIKLLVEHGADVNVLADNKTPLLLAYRNNNESILKYLVEHGAVKNMVLKLACKDGKEAIVKYLVEYGADVNNGYDNYFDHFDNGGLYGYDKNDYIFK